MNKKILLVALTLIAISALSGCLFNGVVDEVIDTPRLISVSGAATALPNEPMTNLSLCGEEGFYGAYQRKLILLTGIPYETELKEIRWNIDGHYFTTNVDVFVYPFLDTGWIPFSVVIIDTLGREVYYTGEILVRNRSDYFIQP